ncbi:hypothetical protein AAG906_012124 [Vitis piasezkii]
MDALEANLKKNEDLDDLVLVWDPNLLILATTWAILISQESVKMDEALQKPFGSLVVLRFEEMLEWEEWVCCGVEFPCLKKLYIKKCPKLKGDIPKHLPYLTKLEISECGQLVCCLPMAPSICELKLDKCKDMVVRNAVHLTSLPWRTCHPLSITSPLLNTWRSRNVKIFRLFEMGLPPMLETLEIQGYPILERITHSQPRITSNQLVQEAQKLIHFPKGVCPLIYLPFTSGIATKLVACRMEWGLQTLPFLRSLWIGGHKEERLESFPEEQFLPSTLTSLTIGAFPNLKSLDNKGLQYITSLETLYILNCEKLKSFTKHGLPSSLSHLNISKHPLLKKSIQALTFSAIIDSGKSILSPCYVVVIRPGFLFMLCSFISGITQDFGRVALQHLSEVNMKLKTIWMVWALGGLLIFMSCMALKCAFLYRKNLDMVRGLVRSIKEVRRNLKNYSHEG